MGKTGTIERFIWKKFEMGYLFIDPEEFEEWI
jgi:hypothetical protein